MQYSVYITNNCSGCDKVMSFINENDVKCEVYCTNDNNASPPVDILIYPAMFEGQKLIAYGSDIIQYLRNKN